MVGTSVGEKLGELLGTIVDGRNVGYPVGEPLGGSSNEIFRQAIISVAMMPNTRIESKFGPTLLIV